MERKATKIILMTLGLLYCLSFMMPAAAFSWNQATHAYIADRLGARAGHDNLNEMWGSVTPDYVQLCLRPGSVSRLGIGPDPWNVFRDVPESLERCGHQRRKRPCLWVRQPRSGLGGRFHRPYFRYDMPGYENEGYVITKARLLLNTPLDPANPQRTFGDVFAGLGMSPDEALLVAHLITEEAVDIRLRNDVDPLLGRKLARAARNETKRFSSPARKGLCRGLRGLLLWRRRIDRSQRTDRYRERAQKGHDLSGTGHLPTRTGCRAAAGRTARGRSAPRASWAARFPFLKRKPSRS